MAVIFVQDPDFTLHVGDALQELRALPSESIDCCVTSPPYWGLRDYGTGEWDGGDLGCDHSERKRGRRGDLGDYPLARGAGGTLVRSGGSKGNEFVVPYRDVCGKCGATRTDQQLGLEATPDLYVERLVGVFREVRRVLKPHGTLWLNLGDSYTANGGGGESRMIDLGRPSHNAIHNAAGKGQMSGLTGSKRTGLKPKDMVGIPWRVAFALQADGWYLRSDIIWSKPNPMPESVTDRPTKSHEYVFLLSKGPRYFFDQEAVREAYQPSSIERSRYQVQDHRSGVVGNTESRQNGVKGTKGADLIRRGYPVPNPAGRNVRSVWEIATRPFSEAHFATFPPELVRRCVLAGCPDGGLVLDPFMGSGTTALVAREQGRRSVGIELNTEYAAMAARRLGQLSLLAVES